MICLPFGAFDVKKIVGAGQRAAYIRYIEQNFEKYLGKPHPNGSTQAVFVVDMEQYSFRQLTDYQSNTLGPTKPISIGNHLDYDFYGTYNLVILIYTYMYDMYLRTSSY